MRTRTFGVTEIIGVGFPADLPQFERVVEFVVEISRCLREFLEEVCLCESVCKREIRVLRCVRELLLLFSLRADTFEES